MRGSASDGRGSTSIGQRIVGFGLAGLVLAGALGGPAASPALGHGDAYLWWDEGGSAFKHVIGANQAVSIYAGKIDYLCDFLYPTADVYIVRGVPELGDELVDVSGVPNTIQGATGGLFIEELIGVTVPSGRLAVGTYTVVYDECQDGIVDVFDSVFASALRVDVPTDLPPIDPSIQLLKANSSYLEATWQQVEAEFAMIELAAKLKIIADCIKVGIGGCSAKMAMDLAMKAYLEYIRLAVGAVDPKKAFKDYVKDVQSHYRGIAADPPDPAFDQLAVPIVPPILEAETIDALDAAWLRLGSEAAVEGAIAQALLHALERYQGADAAAEGTGGIQQAEQMRAMAIGLSEQLLRTDAALASLAVVLGTDSDVLDDVAAAAGPELERLVVEGFTADQIRDLRNAGLEPAEIDDLLASLTSEPSLTDLSSAAVLAHIAAHRSGIVETRTGLADLVADLDGRIAALADEPGIMPGLPTADAGGPYGASEGVAVTLDGSGSSDADGALAALDWDLDADGDFDDAAGAGPSATFTGAGTHVVNLRVTDGEGNIDVDTAFVIVGDTRHQPSILTWSPASDRPQVIVGATAGFSMAADDPDGDPVALTWGVDGVPSGSGPSLEFGPATTDEIGFHWISGTASDGAAGGGRSSRDWILQVLAADDDADGWRSNTDCDDADGSVNPDQAEVVLNGKDDDCDPGTSDDGLGPTAAFVSSAPSGGRNVALYDTGPFNGSPSPTSATPMAQSNPWNSQWGLSAAMDFPTGNPAWITTNGGYGVIRLSNNATWLIDRVAVMPTIDLQFRPTRVRDFAVDVSTTGFASESDWSTVLTATAADAATLQSFSVPGGPVAARYVRIRLLSNRGDSVWTSMEQIRLYTPQQSGGSTFDFDDRSTDPDQDIASRLWDFGDGATSTDVDPSHTFAGPGSYPITLTVTDSRGHSATTTLVHRVLAGPTVSFPPKGPINERNAIYGDGYAATDPDGDPVVQLSWDWGDGSPSATQWTSTWQVHNYAQDGTYTIRLTATDAQEQTGTFERQLVVLNVPPTASLSNRSVIGGLPFTYSANPFDAADPITCEWDWGDGSTVTAGCGPQAHVYPSPGAGAPDATYTQTFRVTDDDITVTKTATITVAAKLASRLVADGLTFTFDPPASIGDVTGSKTCTWDFGDGSASVTGCGSQRHAYPAMTPGAADAPHALTLQVTAGGQTATLAGTVTTRTVGHPPVYHADFEGTLGSEWSGVTATEPIQGYVGYGFDGKLLRNATGGNATTLTLTGLPQHTSVDLRFFLAIIDSWDGCVGPGPDTLTIRVDGVALLSEVFENSGCGTQSYVPPPDVTLARHANFGFVGDFGYFRDSAYAMGFDPRFSAIPHTASTLTLEWSYNRQGANDESFGIDNLDVVLNGVPDLNDAPGAEAGGPYAVAEGSTLVLDGSGSADPDGDSLTYAWDLDADGEFDDATGANASITPDDGPASMTVRLRVTDPSGESSTDDATVSVSNVAPTAVLVTPANVAEGGAFNVELGDANDPSSADLAGLTFAFDCGLGGGYGAFTSAMSTACTAGDDDVDAAVRATVRDKDGGVTEYAATVPVFNAPPSGTFGATSPILEGGTSTLTWTGESDPSSSDAAALRHSFACDGLIVSLVDSWIAASVAASTTCSFDDNGSYVVRGRVLDPDNDSESRTAPVFVENVPPSATLATPAIVAEGSSFPISLSDPVDPSAADTAAGFTYAFDCGDGAGFGPFSSSAGATCTASNDGAANVAAMIQDKDGGIRTYEASIPVVNVAPSVAASNDGPKPWGAAVTFSAGASDPSAADRAILAFTWDLDADGAFDDAAGMSAGRSFSTPGTYPIQVRVCDDDTCAIATTVASISSHGTSLVLGGATSGAYSDPAGVIATLTDTTTGQAISGAAVSLTLGSQSASAATDGSGIASPAITLTQAVGSKALQASFEQTALYGGATASGSYLVTRESASLAYSGDTFSTGTSARLGATVSEDADGSLGDITQARVTFDVYVGASACGSGTPTRYGPFPVVDTGTVGDGIGSVEMSMATPAEQTYCIVARLTGAGQTSPNDYYAAAPSQMAVLTVVSTTGKFATGGGWIVDPDSGGHGNFGFTVRFTKSGAPKGQAVYVWRGWYAGTLVDIVVKSNSMTGLSFADDLGNGTFPWRATLDGKASIRISRVSDGTLLWSDGNATFRMVAIDSGQSSGIGEDTFAIRVLDKDGNEVKLVGQWSGPSSSGGVPLSGGNVMVHLR